MDEVHPCPPNTKVDSHQEEDARDGTTTGPWRRGDPSEPKTTCTVGRKSGSTITRGEKGSLRGSLYASSTRGFEIGVVLLV